MSQSPEESSFHMSPFRVDQINFVQMVTREKRQMIKQVDFSVAGDAWVFAGRGLISLTHP